MSRSQTLDAESIRRFKSRLHDSVVSAIIDNPRILRYPIIDRGEILYTQRDFPYEFASGSRGSIDIFYVIFLENMYHFVGVEYETTSYGENHAKIQLNNAKRKVAEQYREILQRILHSEPTGKVVEWHGLFVYCAADMEDVIFLQEILDALNVEEISNRYLG